MLADFYITRLSNYMKIAVQKNHLGGQILYRSLYPSKKRRHPFKCVLSFGLCVFQLSAAVGAILFAPIGIGLTLGYSSGAIESLKKDPNIVTTPSTISWFGSIMTVGAALVGYER